LVGWLLLLGLCWHLPVGAVTEAVSGLGVRILAVFAFGLVWIACDLLAMAIQAQYRVPWSSLLRVELIAEALARLVPAGGLGGEPYRIRVMAGFVGYEEAGRIVLRYRLVHALSGLAFAACMLLAAPRLHPLPLAWSRAYTALGAALALVTLLLTWVSVSSLPSRFSDWLLGRLGFAQASACVPEGGRVGALWGSMLCKQTAFTLQLAEVWVIFRLLGVQATLAQLVVVAAAIAGTGTVMFMVPGGLGVSELGITVACEWLGLPAWMGLTLGLVRRARLVAWTLVGLALYAAEQLGLGRHRSPRA
jgi:Lysylphosphatidylglycerol synthase TM region